MAVQKTQTNNNNIIETILYKFSVYATQKKNTNLKSCVLYALHAHHKYHIYFDCWAHSFRVGAFLYWPLFFTGFAMCAAHLQRNIQVLHEIWEGKREKEVLHLGSIIWHHSNWNKREEKNAELDIKTHILKSTRSTF